jgi:hypothetical protein
MMMVSLGLFAGLTLPVVAVGQPNLISNGDFDADINGWSFEGDAGIDLTRDSSLGNPAVGSLRLSNDGPVSGLGSAEALSACFDPPPGVLFRLEARTYAQGNVLCRAFISRYEEPGCTGDRLRIGFPGIVLPDEDEVWIARSQVETPTPRPSFRVSLFAGLNPTGEASSCNFDAVVLTDPAAAVPTTSEIGLVVLALALALLGLWSVRIR